MNNYLNLAIILFVIGNNTLFGLYNPQFVSHIPQVTQTAFAQPRFFPQVTISTESIRSFDVVKFLQSEHISPKNRTLAQELAQQFKKEPREAFLNARYAPLVKELCTNFGMYQIPAYRDFITSFTTIKANFIEISKNLCANENFYLKVLETCKNSTFNTIDFIFCGGKIPIPGNISQSLCQTIDQSLTGTSLGCRHFILAHLKYGDHVIVPLTETDKIHIVKALPGYQFSEFSSFVEKITQNATPAVQQAVERVQNYLNFKSLSINNADVIALMRSLTDYEKELLSKNFSYHEIIEIENFIAQKSVSLLSNDFAQTREKLLTDLDIRSMPEFEKIINRLPFNERLHADCALQKAIEDPKIQQKFISCSYHDRSVLYVWKEKAEIAQITKQALEKNLEKTYTAGEAKYFNERARALYNYIARRYAEKYEGLRVAFNQGKTEYLINHWAFKAYQEYLSRNALNEITEAQKQFFAGIEQALKKNGFDAYNDPKTLILPGSIAIGFAALGIALPLWFSPAAVGYIGGGLFTLGAGLTGYSLYNQNSNFERGQVVGDIISNAILCHLTNKFLPVFIEKYQQIVKYFRTPGTNVGDKFPEFTILATPHGSADNPTITFEPEKNSVHWDPRKPAIFHLKTPVDIGDGIKCYLDYAKVTIQNNKILNYTITAKNLPEYIKALLRTIGRDSLQQPLLATDHIPNARNMPTNYITGNQARIVHANVTNTQTFTADPSFAARKADSFLEKVKNFASDVKKVLTVSTDGNSATLNVGGSLQLTWFHGLQNRIAQFFGISVDTVKKDLLTRLCDFKKLPASSRAALKKSDLTEIEAISFISQEITLSPELKKKIANDPYIRLDDHLAALTSRWEECPLRQYERELMPNAFYGTQLTPEQQILDQHSIAIAQEVAKKCSVQTDTKHQPCSNLIDILKGSAVSPATLYARAKAVERMRYCLNFDINHPDFIDVRLEILTQTNYWHDKDFWQIVSVFKETAAFKKALSERLLTDAAFHHELVTKVPGFKNHDGCAFLHTNNLELTGACISKAALKYLTNTGCFSPEECCHFNAYCRSCGNLGIEVSQSLQQKLIQTHHAYRFPEIWNAIKGWPITQRELIRVRDQMLQEKTDPKSFTKSFQSITVKHPGVKTTLDLFIKQKADEFETAMKSRSDVDAILDQGIQAASTERAQGVANAQFAPANIKQQIIEHANQQAQNIENNTIAQAENLVDTIVHPQPPPFVVPAQTAEQATIEAIPVIKQVKQIILSKVNPPKAITVKNISGLYYNQLKDGTYICDIADRHIMNATSEEQIAKRDHLAYSWYQKIRNYNSDIDMISKNTNLSREIIQQIKNHLFYKEHFLLNQNNLKLFDPDIQIASAWNRLMIGEYIQNDIQLIMHEYAESILMNRINIYDFYHDALEKNKLMWIPPEYKGL